MTIDTLFRLASSWLPALLSHLWSSTIFLLLMLGAASLMRWRLTAGARFAIVFIGILKFAIPGGAIVAGVKSLAGDMIPAAPAGPLEIPFEVLAGPLRSTPPSISSSPWPAIGIAIWLLVALAIIIRLATTRRRLVSLSVRTALPPTNREIEALSSARRRSGVRHGIDLVRSATPESPAVLRVLRPLIVLPANGCDDLTDEELESLLRHECAHVKRHDNLLARIESLIAAMFWFHPLLWLARRVTAIERERACDELVAGSDDERDTYLAALSKFCHASIATRLPGVSCMATAKLKERMDHVMNYQRLKALAPSPHLVAAVAFSALVLFTAASGIIESDRAFAETTNVRGNAYAVKVTASRTDGLISVESTVSENKTQTVIAAPTLTVEAGHEASTRTVRDDGLEIILRVRPDPSKFEDAAAQAFFAGRIAIEVTIEKGGKIVQKTTTSLRPDEKESVPRFTGAPIDLMLKDADLRDVVTLFGKLTNLEMRMDESIQGKVSVSWHSVPWDEAFDSLMREHSLTYRIEEGAIHIARK
ncbi:MAG TPA: M56 family metallopeptidase [Thermoanaerobaculia bacterium]|nr:M56 family metallopeptidase [Thermoanaerobaculia bacterium]